MKSNPNSNETKIQKKKLINNNDKTEPVNPTIIPVLMCDCDSFLFLNVKQSPIQPPTTKYKSPIKIIPKKGTTKNKKLVEKANIRTPIIKLYLWANPE